MTEQRGPPDDRRGHRPGRGRIARDARAAVHKRRRRQTRHGRASPASPRRTAARPPGATGDRTCPNGPGAPCARTTAPTATRGRSSRTTTPGPGCTAGTRTGWPGSATRRRTGACPSGSGTASTRSSRSGCSASPGRRAITARTSRSTGGTWTGRRPTPGTPGATTTRSASSPTAELVAENARRGKLDPEYELVDTGVFDEDRYWVVTVDYAKGAPRDLLMRITVENAGPAGGDTARAADALVPQHLVMGVRRPPEADAASWTGSRIVGSHSRSGPLVLVGDGDPEALFCENETNNGPAVRRRERHALPQGRHQRPRPARRRHRQPAERGHEGGAALHGDGSAGRIDDDQGADGRRAAPRDRRRPDWRRASSRSTLGAGFDDVVATRQQEADDFYASVIPAAHARRGGRGRPAGVRRAAVGKAVLPLRREALARRRSRPAAAAAGPRRHPQRRTGST